MKHVIVVPDGMADRPVARLGDRTPMEAAAKPNMDKVALAGRLGLVCHTPASLPPGSDVAMLSVLGYDPTECYTGRAPLEAASMGIDIGPREIAFRCNLVTVDADTLVDHSAGHISTREAAVLVDLLSRELGDETIRFYPGVGYRHLLVYRGPERIAAECTPPHDMLDQPIGPHLPRGQGAEILIQLMQRSRGLLAPHEINDVRIDLGENPANMIWLWGGGMRPQLAPFAERYGTRGAVVAAVDLVRGIAASVGLDVIRVEGATGYIQTNYAGKGQAAIEALDRYDFVFVHIEAPDEAGHQGNVQAKVDAIEAIDKHIVGPLLDALEARGAYRLLVMPDHPTPLEIRTHVGDPVPFAYCGSDVREPSGLRFTEANAAATGLRVDPGHRLLGLFLKSMEHKVL
ncbi:MAG TPA: cofactor-independent phosphoglycerate mutase [Planctomycetota bacterium]|nr:cofactor-independent phosphoglycerate mutase [Planctomycetota bacterium]